jgi:hypothetical protein
MAVSGLWNLVSGLLGALAGAGIGAWALFCDSKRREDKRQEQATRALLAEMYANALRLRGAAQAMQQDKSTDPPDFLQGQRYDEAYRMYFTDASSGAKWDDIEKIIQAYAYAGTVTDGSLSVQNLRRNPKGFPLKEDDLTKSFAKTYAHGAGIFCDAIRRLMKLVAMDEAFDSAVQKVEKDVSSVLDVIVGPKAG